MGIFKSKPVDNTELLKCLDNLKIHQKQISQINKNSKKVKN